MRSLQDVLALLLLEEYGRRRGKTVIIKSFQAHPDGNVKFEEYLVTNPQSNTNFEMVMTWDEKSLQFILKGL